jgi:hypothetical protein
MDTTTAAASASSSLVPAGGTQTRGPAGGTQPALGPCLYEHMGEPAFIAALNAWGSARDREALELRADLSATQVGVSGAFEQAQETVLGIVAAFRNEVVTMRQQTHHEAQQSIARLEQVVAEARAKFGEQDIRFTTGLVELSQRLQAADTWAQAEPARIAAIVQSVPAPAPTLPPLPAG